MPNRSQTPTTPRNTGTRASAAPAKPGSGSASPRLSEKARQLARANRKLKSEVLTLRSECEHTERARRAVANELARIADGYVQRDTLHPRRRRFVVDIDEDYAMYRPQDVYGTAIRRLMQSLFEHHITNLPETLAKEVTGKMERRAKGKAIMQAMGFNYYTMRECHMLISVLMQWERDPMYRAMGNALSKLRELLTTGVDVLVEEHHRASAMPKHDENTVVRR